MIFSAPIESINCTLCYNGFAAFQNFNDKAIVFAFLFCGFFSFFSVFVYFPGLVSPRTNEQSFLSILNRMPQSCILDEVGSYSAQIVIQNLEIWKCVYIMLVFFIYQGTLKVYAQRLMPNVMKLFFFSFLSNKSVSFFICRIPFYSMIYDSHKDKNRVQF